LFEQCDDSIGNSPHGHAAFYIAEMSVVAFDRLEPGAELLEYIALS